MNEIFNIITWALIAGGITLVALVLGLGFWAVLEMINGR